MSRKHVNYLRNEIKSSSATGADVYEIFRKEIIRTFMDVVEGDQRHDYDSRLIREFNNKCDQVGHINLKIYPDNAGFTYTGQESGVPAIDLDGAVSSFENPNFTGYGTDENPNYYDGLIVNYNGHTIGRDYGIGTYDNLKFYYFHSPMFLSNQFRSLANNQLMSRESYHLIDDGQLIGYKDEGGNHNNGLTPQNRILKMFGIGSTLDNSFNEDFARLLNPGSFAADQTPITCISNINPPSPQSGVLNSGYWAKYEISQFFNDQQYAANEVPQAATGCIFGGYVKVPTGDPLRELNFGGFLIKQEPIDGVKSGYVDVVQVKGSDFHQNPTTIGQDGSYADVTGLRGCYNWGQGRAAGFSHRVDDGGLRDQRITEGFNINGCATRLLTSINQDECREWTKISGSFNLYPGQTGQTILMSIFYAENHSYLNGDGVKAGSIHIANPFLLFK